MNLKRQLNTGFKDMKKYFLTILFILVSCSLNRDKKVVATVGGRDILIDDFKVRYEQYLFSTGMNDKMNVRTKILNDMIDETLLYYYDDNEEIFNNKYYEVEEAWQEKQAVLAWLKDREIYAKIKAGDEEIRQAFRRMNERIAARHLFAETEEEANELYQLLQAGSTFEELAKTVFSDSLLRNNGGYLGYFTWGDFDPAFEDAAFKLKIGQISKPVKTEFGYSIIKLEDRVVKPIITENEFQNKKKQIARAVKINKKHAAEKNYIRGVVDLSNFKFSESSIKKIFNLYFTDSTKTVISGEGLTDDFCFGYGDKKYSEKDVYKKLFTIPNFHLRKITNEKKLKTALKGLILQDKLMSIAESKGYDKLPAVVKTREKLKMSLFMKYKKLDVLKNVSIPDSAVYDYYLNHPDFFSEHKKINVSEIIVADSLLAYRLFNKIKGGGDFGGMARRYSIRKETASKDGNIGFVNLSKFGKLAEVFWNSNIGAVLKPININGYFGIFKILDKKPEKLLNFSDVKADAELIAKYSFRNDLFKQYLDNLKKKIKITVNKKLLGGTRIETADVK